MMGGEPSPGGIDRRQLGALVRTGLRCDWRGAVNPLMAMNARKSRFPGLAVVILMDLFISLIFGAAMIKMPGLFEGLVIIGMAPLVLVGMQVLIEFNQIVITPGDHFVVAAHPVNAQTFFAAKLVHLIAYVSLLAAACALFPAVFATFAFHNLLAFPVVLVHFWLVSVFSAVSVVTVFVTFLSGMNRRRMEKVGGYMQIVMALLFYGSINLLPKHLERIMELGSIDHYPWVGLLPTFWFAAPVAVVTNGFAWRLVWLWGLGMLLLGGMVLFTVRYLAKSYSLSLSDPKTAPAPPGRRVPMVIRRVWQRVTSPETRAIALLAWAQFKHDLQFRMQVIWIIPITLFFLVWGFIDGARVFDPFLGGTQGEGIWDFASAMMVVFCAMGLYSGMAQSKAWQAAWVMHLSPSDRSKLVVGSQQVALMVLGLMVAPVLAAVYTWLFGNVVHAVLHVIVIILFAGVGLKLMILIAPRLPFSMESAQGGFSGTGMLIALVPMLVVVAPLSVILLRGYGGYLGWGLTAGAAIAVGLALTPWQRHRIAVKTRDWLPE